MTENSLIDELEQWLTTEIIIYEKIAEDGEGYSPTANAFHRVLKKIKELRQVKG